ncbi:MAG: tRNA (N(6)-L-threonylcarbamoyladenosine(37)-C(2))-methylthiotransferase MtaB [Candidatus Puniceispirillum sp.]|nr:tRNA (N(6)-L-threonylcarbamoyladenosine(37)-C(2))-methylthiotransferase MtaB [Candidatus Puniceispirillum sp.]
MPKRNAPQVETFGCRLNIWESEVIRDKAASAGLQDAIIFNTCAVTSEAEKQARQAIRKARRENPDSQIIVTGCAVQIAAANWANMDEVDVVLGNHDKLQDQSWLDLGSAPARALGSGGDDASKAVREGTTAEVVSDIMQVREMASHMLDGFQEHTRAFLQIQQGCDHRCTFCIIPYGRGNNRSAGLHQIIEAAQSLVDGGACEIVLTGVDITSWGSDLAGRPRLGRLIRSLLREIPDLQRLRLSSIDPAEGDAELMAVLGDDDRLMPHVHISAQHGNDLILKRMKRRHLGRDIIRFCDEARRRRPDIVFGADMIAGFPTEDDAAHQASCDMIERAGITHLHVFPYSPRPGTPAASMPPVAAPDIKRRAASLRALGTKRLSHLLDNSIGSFDQLLAESGNKGHGRNFSKIRLEGEYVPAGSLVNVKITGRDGNDLIAERV